MIYISSISGIDPSFYEAAELDGASKWKQIRYITLPSIMPSVITLTLLNIGRIFYSDFGLFYQVTQNSGQLYDTTNVIDTYVYRALLQSGNIGMASAAGFYQSIVGFACVLLANVVGLGYGVMVTLQILVLPFLVRVRVSQQRSQVGRLDFFFYLHFLIFGQRECIGGVVWRA